MGLTVYIYILDLHTEKCISLLIETLELSGLLSYFSCIKGNHSISESTVSMESEMVRVVSLSTRKKSEITRVKQEDHDGPVSLTGVLSSKG